MTLRTLSLGLIDLTFGSQQYASRYLFPRILTCRQPQEEDDEEEGEEKMTTRRSCSQNFKASPAGCFFGPNVTIVFLDLSVPSSNLLIPKDPNAKVPTPQNQIGGREVGLGFLVSPVSAFNRFVKV